ncbi:hypothetical protein L1049_007371 [Liquidambar formosana]|uniref:3'-5' exonuclease domain-containing protein n=1 Tax=Liquidambar formosana TaxID=63359 RepID=A0AAP0N533_LIQFO
MEITIHEDQEEEDYVVTIGDKRIHTVANVGNSIIVRGWLREVKRVYAKNHRKILVGLCADRPLRYKKGQVVDEPYQILQLCIDSHCLIFDLEEGKPPCALKAFLRNPRIEFVGIGIHRVAEKLDEKFGLYVGKPVDLHELVREAICRNDLGRRGLEMLAKIVLGEDMDITKPSHIEWEHSMYYNILSDDKVKFATVDAFLSYKIGDKCKKIIRDNKSNKNHVSFS